MASAELLEIADELYAGPISGFVAARDAAARAAASKELGAQIKALRKPSTAAWAVNLLVRRESEQIEQVLGIAEDLRVAASAMDGEELRTLTRQRRRLTAALTTTAAELVREYDVRLTAALADQVEGTLTAAMLDPVAAEVVRSGLVVTAFTSTGVSDLDVGTVCAVPESLGHRAAATERATPSLHVVPDHGIRLEAARERVDEAVVEIARATEELQHLRARSENLGARRLQLQGEIDELRRRLVGLEEDLDALDDEIDGTEEEIVDAVQMVDEAEASLVEARREVSRCGG